jgi:hypothetical protein
MLSRSICWLARTPSGVTTPRCTSGVLAAARRPLLSTVPSRSALPLSVLPAHLPTPATCPQAEP